MVPIISRLIDQRTAGIRNIKIQYGQIGLMIGAPPSQADCCLWQGQIAPDGQATNAPVSESNMDGFLFYGCQTAIWFRQPNGCALSAPLQISGLLKTENVPFIHTFSVRDRD
jgi:hypothetical protein